MRRESRPVFAQGWYKSLFILSFNLVHRHEEFDKEVRDMS